MQGKHPVELAKRLRVCIAPTGKKAGSIQRTGCMLPAYMGWDLASLRRGLGQGGDEASPWGRLGRLPRSSGRRRRDARSRGGAPA